MRNLESSEVLFFSRGQHQKELLQKSRMWLIMGFLGYTFVFFYKHKGYKHIEARMLAEKTIGLLFYNNNVYCLNLSIFEAGLNLPDDYKKKV